MASPKMGHGAFADVAELPPAYGSEHLSHACSGEPIFARPCDGAPVRGGGSLTPSTLANCARALRRPPRTCPAPGPLPPRSNNMPIDARPPRLVRTATNGQAYRAGADGFEFWLLHLYGTPYEQGLAQGTLMAAEARAFVNATWEYFKQQLAIPGLPQWLEDLIGALRSAARQAPVAGGPGGAGAGTRPPARAAPSAASVRGA